MKRIPLTQGREAFVSDKDYGYLMQWKWYFNGGYAVRNKPGPSRGTLMMHTVVARRKGVQSREVDHMDRNRLNNQRSNLRAASRQQNVANSGPRRNGRTGFRGVTWRGRNQKFQARITVNGNQESLGLYRAAVEAAQAYNKAASKYFGPYAYQNRV